MDSVDRDIAVADELSAHERSSLQVSALAALAFTVVAITWGLAASSQIILFDGVYSVIGLGLSWLTLRASVLIGRGPNERFPFGREAFGPAVVGVSGMILIGSFTYAVVDAVLTIVDGGSRTEVGWAFWYGVFSLIACIVVAAVLRRRRRGSDLVRAEAAQWGAGAVLGTAMAVGFAAALVLGETSAAWLVPYVDPVLVLVGVALVLPTPLGMLRQTYRELLEGAPPPEVEQRVRGAVLEVATAHGLPEPQLYMSKLGRKLYVEIDVVVGDEPWTVAGTDAVRRDLARRLRHPGESLWLNLELHADPYWEG